MNKIDKDEVCIQDIIMYIFVYKINIKVDMQKYCSRRDIYYKKFDFAPSEIIRHTLYPYLALRNSKSILQTQIFQL